MNSSPSGGENLNESSYVLDASALLAIILPEPGAERVAAVMRLGAAISAVNLSEAVAKLIDYGWSDHDIESEIAILSLRILPFDAESAWLAGRLRTTTRHAGLSLGDRICLALATQLGLPVLTADGNWVTLDVRVELCR